MLLTSTKFSAQNDYIRQESGYKGQTVKVASDLTYKECLMWLIKSCDDKNKEKVDSEYKSCWIKMKGESTVLWIHESIKNHLSIHKESFNIFLIRM